MFEMFTWELHATFLRNHNARPRRTHAEDVQAQKTYKPTRKLKPRRRPHPRPPQLPEAQGHCTRYGALHPNRRGALPTDRVQRPNTQEQTRNWQTEPLPHHNQPGQPPALGRIAPRQHKSDRTPLHALLGTASGSMGAAPAATYRANMRMKGRTRPPTGNDDPVSADSGPSPRPRWLQYRSAFPVRRCGRPQFRRPAPCR